MQALAFHALDARRRLASLAIRRSPRTRRIARIVSATLGEPSSRAQAIAAASALANRMHYVTAAWLVRQRPPTRRRFVEQMAFPDQADVQRVLGGEKRGLLVVSIHTAGYLPGILRLCQALRPGQRVNLLKREPPGPQDALFDDPVPARELRILRTSDHPGLATLAALRGGEAACAMLDVPPAFDAGPGYTAAVLGRTLQLPRGPAELAVRSGALVLPVVAIGEGIECAPLIDTSLPQHTSRGERIGLVQGQLARLVDRWIRARPHTWMLWSHLPAFVHPEPPRHPGRGEPGPPDHGGTAAVRLK